MKRWLRLIVELVSVLCLAGCGTKSLNAIIASKPSVTGIVQEVHADYVLLYADAAEGYPYGSTWSISLQPENKDSYTDVVVGDEITVYHDGNVMETDPLCVGTVYAITLKTPAQRAENNKP